MRYIPNNDSQSKKSILSGVGVPQRKFLCIWKDFVFSPKGSGYRKRLRITDVSKRKNVGKKDGEKQRKKKRKRKKRKKERNRE